MTWGETTISQLLAQNSQLQGKYLRLAEVITERRGAVVAKLVSPQGTFALKAPLPDAANVGEIIEYSPKDVIRREAGILETLGQAADNLYADSELETPWLLTHWQEAPSAAKFAKTLRQLADPVQKRHEFTVLFRKIAGKVAQVHAAGYLHGDLQPDHFLITADHAMLLDWALAHQLHDPQFQYKGSFVHVAAPEVAAQMLAKAKAVDYDFLSETFTLGAVFYYLYTGQTAVNYGTADSKTLSMQEILQKAASGLNQRGFIDEPDAKIEQVLLWALEPDRKARCPNVAALLEALTT